MDGKTKVALVAVLADRQGMRSVHVQVMRERMRSEEGVEVPSGWLRSKELRDTLVGLGWTRHRGGRSLESARSWYYTGTDREVDASGALPLDPSLRDRSARGVRR